LKKNSLLEDCANTGHDAAIEILNNGAGKIADAIRHAK